MSRNTVGLNEPIWDSRNQDWDTPVARQVTPPVKYHLVEANTANELEQLVNQAISQGWLVSGGISVVPIVNVDAMGYSHLTRYSQAMTK